jgi:hypothetical protein
MEEKTIEELIAENHALALKSWRLRNLRTVKDAPLKVTPPSVGAMVVSASKSLKKWVGSGLSKSTQEVIDMRLDICKGCEFWDSQALNGTGRCRKCGCSTWAKIRMATEKCPIGKWGPVSNPSTNLESTPEQETTKT